MPNILALLTALAGKVSASLSPFAKALVPAVVSLVAAIIVALTTGTVDAHALSVAASGVVAALLTYLVPNSPPSPPSVPPVSPNPPKS